MEHHLNLLEILPDSCAVLDAFNTSINTLFNNINSAQFNIKDEEIEDLNLLFSRLGKSGRKKAQDLGLTYNQPKLRVIKHNGEKRIIILAAQTKLKEQPIKVSNPNIADVKNKIIDFKVLERPVPAELKNLRKPEERKSFARKAIYVVSISATLMVSTLGLRSWVNDTPVLPTYTQMGVNIKENTQSLRYSVAAKKQDGVAWEGYELNGLTNKDWWYQAVLNYKDNSFSLVYNVFDNNLKLIFIGSVPFSGHVNNGDNVDISLSIDKGKVNMNAQDTVTHADAKISFDAHGETFVGGKIFKGATTGVMTETLSEPGFGPREIVYQRYTDLSNKPREYSAVEEDRFLYFPILGTLGIKLSARDIPGPHFTNFIYEKTLNGPVEITKNHTFLYLDPHFVVTSGTAPAK